MFKARFILRGHRDRDKRRIVYNANTLKQSSIRFMLALASILGFDMWATDINQAYLQSASELRRKIFLRPDVLELSPDHLIQVLKPLYGFTDAGYYWGETLTDHHKKLLEIKQAEGDFSLFYKRLAKRLIGVPGSYVDDIIRVGADEFRRASSAVTSRAFDTKPSEDTPFAFAGLEVTKHSVSHSLGQKEYILRLKLLRTYSPFEEYRSMSAKLAWVVHSRSDIAFAVSMEARATERIFGHASIKLLNKIIKHLQNTISIRMKYPKLDPISLYLVVYSDASFNNNKDNSSQLGSIILLMDKYYRASVLHFSSYKSRRVTRFRMAAETLAIVDGLDNAFIPRHDLQPVLCQKYLC